MSDSPHIKFEHSPVDSLADSFVFTPNTAYPSLFHTNDTMDPSEVMTPQSFDDESMFGGSMNGGSIAGTPAPEKKPVKKNSSAKLLKMNLINLMRTAFMTRFYFGR